MKPERPPPEPEAIVVLVDVSALAAPDAQSVDDLARLQLAARRRGCTVTLCHARDELRDLIAFVGLGDVLRIEPGRQAEQREQPRGVEEEGDPGEPVA